MSKGGPLAVGSPWNSCPYQLAQPTSPSGIVNAGGRICHSLAGVPIDRADKAVNTATVQPRTSFLNSTSARTVNRQSGVSCAPCTR